MGLLIFKNLSVRKAFFIYVIFITVIMLSSCVETYTYIKFDADGGGEYYQELLLKDDTKYKYANSDLLVYGDAGVEVFSKVINGDIYTGIKYKDRFSSSKDFIGKYRSSYIEIKGSDFSLVKKEELLKDTYVLKMTLSCNYSDDKIVESLEYAGIEANSASIKNCIEIEMPGSVIECNNDGEIIDNIVIYNVNGIDSIEIEIQSQVEHRTFDNKFSIIMLILIIIIFLFILFLLAAWVGKRKIEKRYKSGDTFIDN